MDDRRLRRAGARARARRRARLLGLGATVAVTVAVVAAVVFAAVRNPTPHAAARPPHGTVRTTSTTTTLPPTTTTTTTDPGTLPQTGDLPPATTPQFTAEMQALWQGVVQDSVTPALPAFFPRTAYVQLKTGLADASADWQNRLVADYALDIGAAHDLLGPDASQAMLVSVSVPEQNGHWIPAGVCDNGIGYYEVANSRVVYQLGGLTRSFGIASLISWRGVWYVVHLGAILRGSGGGVVDGPAIGTGTSAYSRTC